MSLMSPKMGQSKEGKKEVDAPTAAGGTRTASIIGHVVSKLWKIILSYCTFKIFWDIFVLMDNLYIYWAKACTIFRFSLLCFGMVEFEQQVKYACFFYSFVWGPSTDGLGYTMWLTRDVPKCDGVSFRMWVTLEGIRTSPLLMGCLLCPFSLPKPFHPLIGDHISDLVYSVVGEVWCHLGAASRTPFKVVWGCWFVATSTYCLLLSGSDLTQPSLLELVKFLSPHGGTFDWYLCVLYAYVCLPCI
jgi:hypothetical protein